MSSQEQYEDTYATEQLKKMGIMIDKNRVPTTEKKNPTASSYEAAVDNYALEQLKKMGAVPSK